MAGATPVGREEELEALRTAFRAAETGRPAFVFLIGPTGSGKSSVLSAFAGELAKAEDHPEVVSVLCYEYTPENALGPIGEVLRALTNRDKRGERARRALKLIRQVAPPLVELIPIIGKVAALGLQTAADLGAYAIGDGKELDLADDVAAALLHVALEIPLLVVIDDAQWLDTASIGVIERLAKNASTERLMLVSSYDHSLVPNDQPLAHLQAQIVGSYGGVRIVLDDLELDGVRAVLGERYGDIPDARLAEWLLDCTDGNPQFLQQYLAMLEEQGTLRRDDGGKWGLDGKIEGAPGDWTLDGALARASTPKTLMDLLAPRVAHLEEDEKLLLETGSVQGRRFLSTVLGTLLNRDADELWTSLGRIQERHGMIALEEAEDWWTDRSDLYSFDPGVLQELLYGRIEHSGFQRRRRHLAVAEVLEALIAHDDPKPRHALLEIARHRERAGDALGAARVLVGVADSTFAEGADRETAISAERAVRLSRKALERPGPDADDARRLLVRAIVLLIISGEASWRAGAASADGPALLALAQEAVAAADAIADDALRASARYAAAHVQTRYAGLHEAIATYNEALEAARNAGDTVGQLAILTQLGYHTDSLDLEKGWALLQQAHALVTGDELAARLDPATLAYQSALLDQNLGIAAFDLGRYGDSIEYLSKARDALRLARWRDLTSWTLVYFGQLYTAIGLYEEAEASLSEGLELFANERGPLGVRGYLHGLLGHLYVEWEPPRLDRAREELTAAARELEAVEDRSIGPLVACYRGELALAEGTTEALESAEALLATSASFGWARAEIRSASLRARIALAEGRLRDALEHSRHAVALLAEHDGVVPATRGEEVLQTHAEVLRAAGDGDEAQAFEDRAAAIVRAKAQSLSDPKQRASYLERVRLSRAIQSNATSQ
jgi:tetratricopeptide (TPR) repeat protein